MLVCSCLQCSGTLHMIEECSLCVVEEHSLAERGSSVSCCSHTGVCQRCFFLDTDDQTNSVMMQLNFNAPRTLIRSLIPGITIYDGSETVLWTAIWLFAGMLSREFGHIVNISSVCGKGGMPLRASYCATKFALQGLTYSLYYEVSYQLQLL